MVLHFIGGLNLPPSLGHFSGATNKAISAAEKPPSKAEGKPMVPGAGPSTKSPTFGDFVVKKAKVCVGELGNPI